jgi:hypothetical protein
VNTAKDLTHRMSAHFANINSVIDPESGPASQIKGVICRKILLGTVEEVRRRYGFLAFDSRDHEPYFSFIVSKGECVPNRQDAR